MAVYGDQKLWERGAQLRGEILGAERLEQAINERFGREVLAAHRLEAAYFYPPDAPKIAALSFGNPFGFMSPPSDTSARWKRSILAG